MLISGCAVWGLGITLTVKSSVGVAPWEVFQVALSRLSGIPLGCTGQIIGLILVVLTHVPARTRPRWGTVAVMFLVGYFIDLWYPHVPEPEQPGVRIITLLAGIATIGFATGLYLRADLGPGPRDAAMFAICRVTRRSVRVSRTLLEVAALAAGALLGGPLGIGTLVYALTIGLVIQFFLRLLGVRPVYTERPPGVCENRPKEDMMESKEDVVSAYEQLIPWTQTLSQVKPLLWFTPIAPGAWSIGGCIAHLAAWDRYVLRERLPRIQPGAQLPLRPDEGEFNARVAAYAGSGISPDALVAEFAAVRQQLVDQLRALPDDWFQVAFTINHAPFTFHSYMIGLVEHSRKHKEEIETFLRAEGGGT